MDLLAHLEAYVVITEEGSFSAAADVLHIPQPVLSRRIKILEQHLGGDLFDRSRRQITSTDLGIQLLPHAKDVLSRVDHLHQMARTALASTAHALGVPPDCDPAALARVIRAGADRGITIGVHELSADDRAVGLADGSLAVALLRVPPEAAAYDVPLGLAAAKPLTGSFGRRSVHLESLRPRRGAGPAAAPAILLTGEDGIGFAAERFRKAAARAGLPEGRVRDVASVASAVAETLAGDALLLCAEPLALRYNLAWSALADPTLHRGYELAVATRRVGNPLVLDWLEPLLAEAIGSQSAAPYAQHDTRHDTSQGARQGTKPDAKPGTTNRADEPDQRARLAAHG
ncbi:LysR family transcriptional regulator [Kribbella sp. NBC_01245]|uniref:LysR family transcriptional regulator n=1 Tax=Kribbella sp. NBC_01245 TaxID=2903578 RepID=UPI002E287F48|nr:LysR family transcriptional regulator [Kribbella sp. NBC_01245]